MSKTVIKDQKFIEAFGSQVKRLRENKGWSQLDLYYETGISPAQIRRIEKGQVNTSISVISYLAQALHIRFTDLVDFEIE